MRRPTAHRVTTVLQGSIDAKGRAIEAEWGSYDVNYAVYDEELRFTRTSGRPPTSFILASPGRIAKRLK